MAIIISIYIGGCFKYLYSTHLYTHIYILDMLGSIYQHLKIHVWMKYNNVWFYWLFRLILVSFAFVLL